MGYVRDAPGLLRKYWTMVTRGGAHGAVVAMGRRGVSTTACWRRTSNRIPLRKNCLDDTEVIRRGLGDLLIEAAMLDDGVAMLYSMPSTYMAYLDGNRSYGRYWFANTAWHETVPVVRLAVPLRDRPHAATRRVRRQAI